MHESSVYTSAALLAYSSDSLCAMGPHSAISELVVENRPINALNSSEPKPVMHDSGVGSATISLLAVALSAFLVVRTGRPSPPSAKGSAGLATFVLVTKRERGG